MISFNLPARQPVVRVSLNAHLAFAPHSRAIFILPFPPLAVSVTGVLKYLGHLLSQSWALRIKS